MIRILDYLDKEIWYLLYLRLIERYFSLFINFFVEKSKCVYLIKYVAMIA